MSNYLYSLKNPDGHGFENCSIEGHADKKILVYNQTYIDENFYQKDYQKGIFTLSKENKEAEEKIFKANKEKARFEEKKLEKNKEQDNKKTEIQTSKKDMHDRTWKIKTDYDRRSLVFCLEGLKGSKENLFNHLVQLKQSETEPSIRIEDLKNKAKLLAEDTEKLEEVLMLDFSLLNEVEVNDIFQEMIVGSEDSSVAGLIKELNNQDWVRSGLDYITEPNNGEKAQCPFCQEKTISKELAEQIKGYFDDSFQEKIKELEKIQEDYKNKKNEWDNYFATFQNHQLMNEELQNKLNSINDNLQHALDKNSICIENKIKEPGKKIGLNNTQQLVEEFQNIVRQFNNDIAEHNKTIENKRQTKKEIKKDFWKIMRWEYKNVISQWKGQDKKLQDDLRKIDSEIKRLGSEIQKQDEIIKEQQENTVNIKDAIDHINDQLKYLAMSGFYIKEYKQKNEPDGYRVVRNGDDESAFNSLSEGEKMIITFLYFMEECAGKTDKSETNRSKIIVIDDPISSLSHNLIFDVACLIKDKFFSNTNYKHIFVLTHSLYFFHELVYKSNSYNLFRITKDNSGSKIQTMEKDEIQNEYQSYWQVINDHPEKSSDFLLANCMRNILEHFFAFTERETLNGAIDKIDKQQYKAFIRYMNRESHSDATNISDSKEINTERFKQAFKEVFEQSGYKSHYEKYMGSDNE